MSWTCVFRHRGYKVTLCYAERTATAEKITDEMEHIPSDLALKFKKHKIIKIVSKIPIKNQELDRVIREAIDKEWLHED